MLAAMREQIVKSPNHRRLADQPCFADGDPAICEYEWNPFV
jgi:hypothetical protein